MVRPLLHRQASNDADFVSQRMGEHLRGNAHASIWTPTCSLLVTSQHNVFVHETRSSFPIRFSVWDSTSAQPLHPTCRLSLVGCAHPHEDNLLKIGSAMRCLNGFFATAPQVTGLYVVTDMYAFHLQARMVRCLPACSKPRVLILCTQLNIWTMGFLISPFLSPFLFGFLVANARCACLSARVS